jgi:hypothetical protein
MIRPRRADTAADPALLDGVLGAAAVLGELRAILAEVAEDGAEDGDGHDVDGESPDDEVVGVVLGLAALADMVARRLSDERGSPGSSDGDGAVREQIDLAVAELLR